MERLAHFLRSPIGSKMIMAVMGLALTLFLVVHMIGNLLMFVGPAAINNYSNSLIKSSLIYVAEAALIFGFLAHLLPGIVLSWRNSEARGNESYAVYTTKGHTSRRSWASRTMIVTGLFLLFFVPYHLYTFKYGTHYKWAVNPEVRDIYRLMVEKFSSVEFTALYSIFMLLLSLHLWHGVGSAFESLGARYRPGVRKFGQLVAAGLLVGFCAVPWFIFFKLKG